MQLKLKRKSHSVSIDELQNKKCNLQVIGINSFSTPHNYTVVRTRDLKKKNETLLEVQLRLEEMARKEENLHKE